MPALVGVKLARSVVRAGRTPALGLGAWARLLVGQQDSLAELQLLKGTVSSSQWQLLLLGVQASRLFACNSSPILEGQGAFVKESGP